MEKVGSSQDNQSDGYDAVAAFEQRRQVYHNVQEVQRLEHEAIRRIADHTASRKRELLRILSDWLLNQTIKAPSHHGVESLSGCAMREWITLQAEGTRLKEEANRCEREALAAANEYKAIAPLQNVGLGVVNEWFAEGEKKTHIQQLASVSARKAEAHNVAFARLNTNIAARQRFGKRFLRGCLANLKQLERSSVFGGRARTIVGELTAGIEAEWASHLRATHAAMVYMTGNMDRLRRIYRMSGGHE